jgi:hypothetical protein
VLVFEFPSAANTGGGIWHLTTAVPLAEAPFLGLFLCFAEKARGRGTVSVKSSSIRMTDSVKPDCPITARLGVVVFLEFLES